MSPYRNEPESYDERVSQLETDVARTNKRLRDNPLIDRFVDGARLAALSSLESEARAETDLHRRLATLDRYKVALDGLIAHIRQLETAIRKPSSARIAAPLRAPSPQQELPQLEPARAALVAALGDRISHVSFEHGFEPRMEGAPEPGRLQLSEGEPGEARPLLCLQARLVYRGVPILLRRALPTRSGRGGAGVHLRCRVAAGLGELLVRDASRAAQYKGSFARHQPAPTGNADFDRRFEIFGDADCARRALSPLQQRQLDTLRQGDPEIELVIRDGNAALSSPLAQVEAMIEAGLPLLAYLHGLDGTRSLLEPLAP